jgi:hypothetical protein
LIGPRLSFFSTGNPDDNKIEQIGAMEFAPRRNTQAIRFLSSIYDETVLSFSLSYRSGGT